MPLMVDAVFIVTDDTEDLALVGVHAAMKKRRLEVVVPCASKQHRVRLNTRKLLASARCPKCKAPVDPMRVRRLLGLILGLYRVSGDSALERTTVWSVWGYLVLALLLWVGLWGLGDVWGPMTVLLFGPRWVLVLPIILLAAVTTRKRPRLLIPLGGALLVVLGPVMGFNLGLRRLLPRSANGTPLRIVTYNVAGGAGLNTSVPWIIEQTRGDIIGLQECGHSVAEAVRDLPEIAWSTIVQDGLCLLSRYPITSTRQLDRENIRVARGSGVVITYAIDLGSREIHLTNLHLDTPRRGLAPVREGDLTEGFNALRSKSVTRDIESRQARAFVDADDGAIIVVGDFNLPVESVIYRRHWGDMLNAFSHAGIGFGYTRFAGWIRARIDHVLVNDDWRVVRAFVGPDFGSDHRPMIADLRLRPIPD